MKHPTGVNRSSQAQEVFMACESSVHGSIAGVKNTYEPPRIITHSAEKLEEVDLTVNACTSFIP